MAQDSHPTPINPFTGSVPPALDPRSEQFNYQQWIRNISEFHASDPQNLPRCNAGVSFRDLSVHGYGLPTDHLATTGNIFLRLPDMARRMFGHKGRRINILRGFEGIVKSGEMLLVLGPPGSGCTTFLKTISGETGGIYLDQNAKINYQGIPYDLMHREFRGEVVYNAERDIHFPNLTVGQTLSFAAKARTPCTRPPGVSREQWAEYMKDVVMAAFGLTHVENTKVGNELVRGVSGGERKRVSIAEVSLGGSALQCWDNSTRGLDSATALEFIDAIKLSTKYTDTTAIIAIYQASQDIYDTFDKVTLLYEGRQIYFGQIDSAKEFFVNMGFHCTERQTTADFLTSLTNPAERRAKPGFEFKVPHTPDEFERAWKESLDRAALLKEIEAFNQQYPLNGEELARFRASREQIKAEGMRESSPYTIPIAMQIRLCLERGFQRLKGDLSIFITTVFGNTIMGLILASMFFNLPGDTTSLYNRSSLLFYCALLSALGTQLEILTLYEQRPIVEKHARMALYHPFSEAISSMICDLPSKLLTSLGFNITVYFMTNLRREPGAFFTYLLFSFSLTLAMSMVFRTVGATSRTISQAMMPSAIIILATLSHAGFVIPTQDMKPWFRWINYLDPIAYVFESLMINEFDGRQFQCTNFLPSGPGYENITGVQRTCLITGSQAGSDVVEGTRYLAASYHYTRAHLWRNFGITIVFIIFFLFTYLFASEYISAAKSKGEVLVFLREYKKGVNRNDEEAQLRDKEVEVESGSSSIRHGKELRAIQKQTANFQWENVCYDIKIKGEQRRILENVDGWVEPGKLTALMGASGAGKTSLLDVLADRSKIGVITGDMFVEGHQRDESFQRKTGYAQQADIHLPTSTVREALVFSARLRQPHHVPDHEKVAYVDIVIQLLGMEKFADAVIGVPGEGLNIEQRKRLTIGVELAAKPELLLFLDEPTSGLDSQTSWSVCTLLRRLADSGQAILCTIHQPSALLFQGFDRLLVLDGGKTIYFGDIGANSRTLINYFERQGADTCPPNSNPAEWMLNTIGAAPGAIAKRDFAEAWRNSPEYLDVKCELSRRKALFSQHITSADEIGHERTEFAAPLTKQFILSFHRVLQQYWRTPSYLYSKIFLCIFTALFIGFTFYKAQNTLQGLQDQMFSVFLLITIFVNLLNQIMPQFVTQRALYEARELPSKTLSWKVFMLANICAELVWNSLMAIILFFCWYYPIGMYRNAIPTDTVAERGALAFLLILAFLVFTSTFTHMMIAGLDTTEEGGNLASLLYALCLLFCGILITPDHLPGFWKFMYRVSPFTYLVDGMLATGLANAPAFCAEAEISRFQPPSGTTCGAYLDKYVSFAGGKLLNSGATSDCQFCAITNSNYFLSAVHSTYSLRWRNFGLIWAYIAFNLIFAFFLYWLARVPKRTKAKNAKKIQ